MKTNKPDELFRKRLGGCEITPSSEAFESFCQQLEQRHRSRRLKIWLRAAGLLLLGAGLVWLSRETVSQRERLGGNTKIANLVPHEAGDKIYEGESMSAENAADIHEKKSITISDAMAPDMKEREEPGGRDIKRPDKPKQASASPETSFQDMEKQVITGPGENLPYMNQTVKAGKRKETVTIRIVYRKTGGKEIKTMEKEKNKVGLLRNGYKKVAAVFDRLNIKEGVRDKLKKTKEELVAMNPVKMFRKEGEK